MTASQGFFFFSNPRGIFHVAQESTLMLFGLSLDFRKLRKQNDDLVLWKKIVLFHRSKKKSTTTFVRSGKKCTATTKRSINAYAQKTFQNPGWVPERKATNPFLNLLLRKNERDIDNKKKSIVKLSGKGQQNNFKRKKTSKSNCKNVWRVERFFGSKEWKQNYMEKLNCAKRKLHKNE